MFEISKILKVIDWCLFLGLCALAALVMYEVLDKFYAEDTSFKIYEESIVKRPTILICFAKSNEFQYGKDFNITYGLTGKVTFETETLSVDKETYFNISKAMVYLEKILTLRYGFCYKG